MLSLILLSALDLMADGLLAPGAEITCGDIVVTLLEDGVIVVDHPLVEIVLRPIV